MVRPTILLACSTVLLPLCVRAEGLPLPDAPLRLVIPDVGAFDRALSGSYKRLLRGEVPESDPMLGALKRSRTGSKLDAEWEAFGGKFPLNWQTLQAMQPSSMGLAILNVGHLEAVMVIETPLAILSLSLPSGEKKTYNGTAYSMVAMGAADGFSPPPSSDEGDGDDGRMGFVWAEHGRKLLLATSERAMKLAVDTAISGTVYTPALDGLVCLELNLDELRKDLYFKREFAFPKGPETGRVHAALRQQGRNMVEVRQGTLPEALQGINGSIFRFEPGNAAVAGWEPDGSGFWPTFRRTLLDPEPSPSAFPQPTIRPLPTTTGAVDNYLVDFTKAGSPRAAGAWEEGDLATWPGLLADVASYGYSSHRQGMGRDERRLVFRWPAAKDSDFVDACKTSMARRHGRATVHKVGDIHEIQVGPSLPALAIRRTGAFLWVADSAANLKDVQTPTEAPDLMRWAKLDLNAAREEGPRWEKFEGTGDSDRPLSDRVLGLLGWMPNTTSITVERKRTGKGWEERVLFGGD